MQRLENIMQRTLHLISNVRVRHQACGLSDNKIVAWARADGATNLPRTDTTGLCPHEDKIVAHADGNLARIATHLEGHVQDCQKAADNIAFNDVCQPFGDSARELQNVRSTTRSELHQAEQDLVEEKKAEVVFRRRNALDRPAHYLPLIKVQIAFWCAVAAEGVLNARLLASSTQDGFVGAAIVGLIAAILNLGIAFATGVLCIRNMRHVEIRRQRWGQAGLILGVALIISLNLFLAHVRIAYAANFETALSKAGPSFLAHPFAIMDEVKAALVFGIGCFSASVTAFLASSVFFDKYPGYCTVARRVVEKREVLEKLRETKQTHIHDTVTNTVDQVRANLGEIERQVRRACHQVSIADHCVVEMLPTATEIGKRCQRQLRLYRETNIQTREDAPPSYFNDDVVPHHQARTNYEARLERLRDELCQDYEQVKAEVDHKTEALYRLEARLVAELFGQVTPTQAPLLHEEPYHV